MIKKLFIILLLALLTSACAQQAAFVSTPPGAQVFIDGENIGVTPCAFDYKLSQNTSHDIKIVKEGYEPIDFVLIADEVDTDARSRWLVAGAVWSPLWIGTIFTNKLKDTYDFALSTKAPRITAAIEQTVDSKGM
jgi:hypothetical protein